MSLSESGGELHLASNTILAGHCANVAGAQTLSINAVVFLQTTKTEPSVRTPLPWQPTDLADVLACEFLNIVGRSHARERIGTVDTANAHVHARLYVPPRI